MSKAHSMQGKTGTTPSHSPFWPGGRLLLIFGVRAAQSYSADMARFCAGSPTDKALWMLIGGMVASIVGVGGLWRGEP
jgi:hypothetical protein